MLTYFAANPSNSILKLQIIPIHEQHGTAVGEVMHGKDFEVARFLGEAGFNDALFGHGGTDMLFGGAGNDFLSGGSEGDWLWGGTGADLLDGGSGFDWAMYDQAASGVTASLANPAMNIGEAAGDSYVSVEGLMGSAFDDELIGDGGDNKLIGNGGRDVLVGGGGKDILYGGAGMDFVSGGAGDDVLYGGFDQDHFYFSPADGSNDIIADFATAGPDHDVIDLQGNGLTWAHLTITDGIRGALVTFTPYQSVFVQNVTAAELTPDMFLF